jgi:hypothetical protein
MVPGLSSECPGKVIQRYYHKIKINIVSPLSVFSEYAEVYYSLTSAQGPIGLVAQAASEEEWE